MLPAFGAGRSQADGYSAVNLENGDASTSSIPHAGLLKRKLQAGTANKSKDPVTQEAKESDDDESEDESRTRSIAKKAKTGFDAFSKPTKNKSKGTQKDDGSGLTARVIPEKNSRETASNPSPNDAGSASFAPSYSNPFAMPSGANPSTTSPDTRPAPQLSATIPATDDADDLKVPVPANTDGLTKSQRKKQRKKEKKALAREEAAREQQLSLGKLAVAS